MTMPDTLSAPGKRTARRQQGVEALVPHIRELIASLERCDNQQLLAETQDVRLAVLNGQSISSPEVAAAGIALATEALRRAHGVVLYDVQLLAVINLAMGRIAQMATGEGKSYVAIATACHLALAGNGVHVMTPNFYLAERDCQQAKPVLAQLGMTVGLTVEQGDEAEKREAYDCHVTYGTGHEFGFDYLRDQLALRSEAAATLGTRLLEQLRTAGPGTRTTMQRGLHYAIVDEADSVLIDDAGSPLVLSLSTDENAPDQDAHLAACQLADDLSEDTDYTWNRSTGHIALTNSGTSQCYDDSVDIPVSVLLRPWTSYVEQALRAKYIFRRNVHYVLADDEVRIVDETTGRIMEDRSWQDGLHQAIEAREGIPITAEKESLARVTRQRFVRLYQNVCGMTGTAVGCERELKHVYDVEVVSIPLRRPSARQLHPMRCFTTRQAKFDAIINDVARLHQTGQPVLVGTQSIADSEAIARQLTEISVPFQLLNGLQNAEEADVISRAGQPGAVTISTNLAGRGTDIKLTEEALARGGLHVIVAECQLSGRMDRQLIGRCARQGDVGAAQVFVSAEDTLIQQIGPWVASAMLREAGGQSEVFADFSSAIRRLQRTAEKQQFLGRANLLRQDLSRGSLFGSS